MRMPASNIMHLCESLRTSKLMTTITSHSYMFTCICHCCWCNKHMLTHTYNIVQRFDLRAQSSSVASHGGSRERRTGGFCVGHSACLHVATAVRGASVEDFSVRTSTGPSAAFQRCRQHLSREYRMCRVWRGAFPRRVLPPIRLQRL